MEICIKKEGNVTHQKIPNVFKVLFSHQRLSHIVY